MFRSIIKTTSVSLLTAPLIQPFRIALGQHDTLENVLFSLELSDGTKGFGEAAIAPHITGETVKQTQTNLRSLTETLPGRNALDYQKISVELHEKFFNNKSALAAVEMALLDALTRQWKMPLWTFFGQKSNPLTTDITIVIADLKETEENVKKFYRQGFRAFKIKIGKEEELDFQRVLTVKRLAKKSAIYLDINQAYNADQAIFFVKRLNAAGVFPELIEQPVPKNDWSGLKKVSRALKVPVCADESVSSLKDAKRAIKNKSVGAINIKLMKTGLIEGNEIALLAKKNGIKLMIGGMMETSLAMTAAAHMASGLGCFDYIDLDTPFFVKDTIKNPYLSSRGVYDLSKVVAGIGIHPK